MHKCDRCGLGPSEFSYFENVPGIGLIPVEICYNCAIEVIPEEMSYHA